MSWKYTGKKRSPAQARQQHLFTKKGQIAGAVSVFTGMANDTQLTPHMRDRADSIALAARFLLEMFDKEVGWK